jgi:TonB family protein
VQQSFPPYPSQVVPASQGVVEVIIDETGAVESVTMTTPVNPAYDNLAVAAAKAWLYKPAVLNGLPVRYRKVIQIVLKPAR